MTEQELIEAAINSGNDSTGRLGGTVDNQHVYWDEQGRPYNKKVGGGKMYIAPLSASSSEDPKMREWAAKMGVKVDYSDPTNHPGGTVLDSGRPGGGMFHESGTWNGNEGQWDQGLDWGNILTMVVAGVLTAGAASALMGGGAAAEAATSTALATGSSEAGMAAATAAGGVGAGEAGAVTGLAGSGLSGGVGAATGAGVGIGETGAVTGLAGSGFGAGGGLGLAAAPTVGDLATVGSSIAGQSGVGSLAATGAKGATTASKISDLLRAGGQEVGALADDAQKNRVQEGDKGLARSAEEDRQRRTALADVYRNNWYNTRQKGPNDPMPLQQMSPEYMATLKDLSDQGKKKLAQPAQYDTGNLAPVTPGTMEQIGQWLSPTLSTIGAVSKILR